MNILLPSTANNRAKAKDREAGRLLDHPVRPSGTHEAFKAELLLAVVRDAALLPCCDETTHQMKAGAISHAMWAASRPSRKEAACGWLDFSLRSEFLPTELSGENPCCFKPPHLQQWKMTSPTGNE